MLKIEDHHRNGGGERAFRIKVSDPGSGQRGFTLCDCDSIEELHEAINHYYGRGPRVEQHKEGKIKHCPLCRKKAEEGSPKLKLVVT